HTRSKRDWSSDVCSSDLLGFFFQQTLDVGDRHVAFNSVTADPGGMTGAKLSCDAKLFPYSGVADIVSADLDAGFFKMLDPFVAATAVGVFPNFGNQLRCGCRASAD